MTNLYKPNLSTYEKIGYLSKATEILSACTQSTVSFHDSYIKIRAGKKGAATDEEQDLLRAMLIFAGAGLDAVAKQLIKDSLPIVISKKEGAELQFQRHVEKRIKKEDFSNEQEIKEKLNFDIKYLSKILTSINPQQVLLEDMIDDLTKDSLQSVAQVSRAGSYFDIKDTDLIPDKKSTKDAFDVRNQIAHEMDIQTIKGKRIRIARREEDIVKHTNTLLKTAERFIEHVCKQAS